MFCTRCQNPVHECECGDIEERLEELAQHPNVATDRCSGCQRHHEGCTCEEYTPVARGEDGTDLADALVEGAGRAAWLRYYAFGIRPVVKYDLWDPVYPHHGAPRRCPFCGDRYLRHGGHADHRDRCEAGPNPGANPVIAGGEDGA